MTGVWPDTTAARPLWLVTLADLALLLVGFFVLVEAHRGDPRRLAVSLRSGFVAAPVVPEPAVPVAANRLAGFAPGSAALPADAEAIVAWARAELRDPRVTVTVLGGAGGEAGDVDPATGSAAILAADRARAIAARLAPLAPARVAVAAAKGPAAVTLSIAFAGDASASDRTMP